MSINNEFNHFFHKAIDTVHSGVKSSANTIQKYVFKHLSPVHVPVPNNLHKQQSAAMAGENESVRDNQKNSSSNRSPAEFFRKTREKTSSLYQSAKQQVKNAHMPWQRDPLQKMPKEVKEILNKIIACEQVSTESGQTYADALCRNALKALDAFLSPQPSDNSIGQSKLVELAEKTTDPKEQDNARLDIGHDVSGDCTTGNMVKHLWLLVDSKAAMPRDIRKLALDLVSMDIGSYTAKTSREDKGSEQTFKFGYFTRLAEDPTSLSPTSVNSNVELDKEKVNEAVKKLFALATELECHNKTISEIANELAENPDEFMWQLDTRLLENKDATQLESSQDVVPPNDPLASLDLAISKYLSTHPANRSEGFETFELADKPTSSSDPNLEKSYEIEWPNPSAPLGCLLGEITAFQHGLLENNEEPTGSASATISISEYLDEVLKLRIGTYNKNGQEDRFTVGDLCATLPRSSADRDERTRHLFRGLKEDESGMDEFKEKLQKLPEVIRDALQKEQAQSSKRELDPTNELNNKDDISGKSVKIQEQHEETAIENTQVVSSEKRESTNEIAVNQDSNQRRSKRVRFQDDLNPKSPTPTPPSSRPHSPIFSTDSNVVHHDKQISLGENNSTTNVSSPNLSFGRNSQIVDQTTIEQHQIDDDDNASLNTDNDNNESSTTSENSNLEDDSSVSNLDLNNKSLTEQNQNNDESQARDSRWNDFDQSYKNEEEYSEEEYSEEEYNEFSDKDLIHSHIKNHQTEKSDSDWESVDLIEEPSFDKRTHLQQNNFDKDVSPTTSPRNSQLNNDDLTPDRLKDLRGEDKDFAEYSESRPVSASKSEVIAPPSQNIANNVVTSQSFIGRSSQKISNQIKSILSPSPSNFSRSVIKFTTDYFTSSRKTTAANITQQSNANNVIGNLNLHSNTTERGSSYSAGSLENQTTNLSNTPFTNSNRKSVISFFAENNPHNMEQQDQDKRKAALTGFFAETNPKTTTIDRFVAERSENGSLKELIKALKIEAGKVEESEIEAGEIEALEAERNINKWGFQNTATQILEVPIFTLKEDGKKEIRTFKELSDPELVNDLQGELNEEELKHAVQLAYSMAIILDPGLAENGSLKEMKVHRQIKI